MAKLLSNHFSLEEFTTSQTAAREGIDNTPDATVLRNLRTLAEALERVRTALGDKPIVISSGYRSKALNSAIGGSSASAHMTGLAVDFIVPTFGTVLQTAKAISACGLGGDQLIYEYGRWVHLGLAAPGKSPRGQLLSIGAHKTYVTGLTDNC
jgi:uncharacterized protein YcbK (DUF882 family)